MYPETIEVNELRRIDKYANLVLTPFAFYKFIKKEGFKTVFFNNKELFVFKYGVKIETPTFDKCKNYKELVIRIESLLDKGFKKPNEIFEGYLFDLENYDLFLEFKESNFKKSVSSSGILKHISQTAFSRDYNLFLEAKKFGNTDRRIFEAAKKLGIPTFKRFKIFQESDFYFKDSSRTQRNIDENSKRYREFSEASKGDFTNRDLYIEAKNKGFSKKVIYEKFQKSGCKTKQEYEKYLLYIEDLPELLKPMGEDILHTLKEADEFYIGKKYGEYYKKRYLIIENISKRAYEEILQKNPKNTVIDNIFEELEQTTNTKIVDKNEMKKYRDLRNDVTHELKNPINKDIADDSRTFFDDLYINLKDALQVK